MKVLITQEALTLKKELLPYTTRNTDLSRVKNEVFPLTSLSQFDTVDHNPTEVSIKSPKIRISADFSEKYQKLKQAENYYPASMESMQSYTLPKYKVDYLKKKTNNFHPDKITLEEVKQIKSKFKKVTNLFNEEQKRKQRMLTKIQQMRENALAEQSEKVERFRFDFDDMTTKFGEKFVIDTRKKRLRERIAKFYLNKHKKYWEHSRSSMLSIPKKTKQIGRAHV